MYFTVSREQKETKLKSFPIHFAHGLLTPSNRMSFAPKIIRASSHSSCGSLRTTTSTFTRRCQRTFTLHASSSSSSNDDDDDNKEDSIDDDRADVRSIEDAKRELEYGMKFGKRMKKRFQPETVKDRGLPIADALVLTSATVLVAMVSLQQHKAPSWLNAEYLREVPRILPNLPALVGSFVHGEQTICDLGTRSVSSRGIRDGGI